MSFFHALVRQLTEYDFQHSKVFAAFFTLARSSDIAGLTFMA